jgi:hypothetical protein
MTTDLVFEVATAAVESVTTARSSDGPSGSVVVSSETCVVVEVAMVVQLPDPGGERSSIVTEETVLAGGRETGTVSGTVPASVGPGSERQAAGAERAVFATSVVSTAEVADSSLESVATA